MSYPRRSRYRSPSCSSYRRGRSLSRSVSRSISRSRSGDSSDVENPGNNLYVTGLSSRITKNELEKHFASEGKVSDVHLVMDPWTRESRGFGFVTMATVEDANRCIKYLDGSVLKGRVITVEKARRRRGRTPTPGRYLGLRTASGQGRSPSYSPYYRSRYSSPGYSSGGDRSYRSYTPYYRRHRSRSYSPYCRRRHRSRSYSPYYYRRHRSGSYSPCHNGRRRSRSLSRSPYGCYSRSPIRRRRRSYSRDSRSYSSARSVSPYYKRHHYWSVSRSLSPRRSISPVARGRSRRNYSPSVSPRPRRLRRSYSCSVSPEVRRRSRRRYSRSVSPGVVTWRKSSRQSYSRSYSPLEKRSKRRPSLSSASLGRSKRRYSRESYAHSRSGGSRSVSSSPVRSDS